MLALRSPSTPEEFEEYFDLRWLLLRAPWQQPRGSERDTLEDVALHVGAHDAAGKLVGVGRLHFVDADTAQIRYMAANDRHRGIGSAIAEHLEQLARERGAARIVLNARKPSAGFYSKLGYTVTGEAPTLFGEIEHVRMEKALDAAESLRRRAAREP
jgi:ribosomal protein S18 acetylase RimI-like enzyme